MDELLGVQSAWDVIADVETSAAERAAAQAHILTCNQSAEASICGIVKGMHVHADDVSVQRTGCAALAHMMKTMVPVCERAAVLAALAGAQALHATTAREYGALMLQCPVEHLEAVSTALDRLPDATIDAACNALATCVSTTDDGITATRLIVALGRTEALRGLVAATTQRAIASGVTPQLLVKMDTLLFGITHDVPEIAGEWRVAASEWMTHVLPALANPDNAWGPSIVLIDAWVQYVSLSGLHQFVQLIKSNRKNAQLWHVANRVVMVPEKAEILLRVLNIVQLALDFGEFSTFAIETVREALRHASPTYEDTILCVRVLFTAPYAPVDEWQEMLLRCLPCQRFPALSAERGRELVRARCGQTWAATRILVQMFWPPFIQDMHHHERLPAPKDAELLHDDVQRFMTGSENNRHRDAIGALCATWHPAPNTAALFTCVLADWMDDVTRGSVWLCFKAAWVQCGGENPPAVADALCMTFIDLCKRFPDYSELANVLRAVVAKTSADCAVACFHAVSEMGVSIEALGGFTQAHVNAVFASCSDDELAHFAQKAIGYQLPAAAGLFLGRQSVLQRLTPNHTAQLCRLLPRMNVDVSTVVLTALCECEKTSVYVCDNLIDCFNGVVRRTVGYNALVCAALTAMWQMLGRKRAEIPEGVSEAFMSWLANMKTPEQLECATAFTRTVGRPAQLVRKHISALLRSPDTSYSTFMAANTAANVLDVSTSSPGAIFATVLRLLREQPYAALWDMLAKTVKRSGVDKSWDLDGLCVVACRRLAEHAAVESVCTALIAIANNTRRVFRTCDLLGVASKCLSAHNRNTDADNAACEKLILVLATPPESGCCIS